MADKIVTVFGGTGFLGRRVVRDLHGQNVSVRVASRHARQSLIPSSDDTLKPIFTDIHNEHSVALAVAGAVGVINAVSLYVERGAETFHAVHVAAAERVARQAQRAGVERLIHISGIGANASSNSPYICKRGEGEQAVQAAFANAIVMRPAVMFGRDDAFLNTLVKLLKRLPIYPMFGRGNTRLQPVYVGDVATAIGRGLHPATIQPAMYELCGPRVYTYEELLKVIAHRLGKKPMLVPVPFAIWHVLAHVAEFLPGSPLTRNQVELMEIDTVASEEVRGFGALGISPRRIEQVLEQIT
jgi:NADH dehydrogenase